MRPQGREISCLQRPEKDQAPWIFSTPGISEQYMRQGKELL